MTQHESLSIGDEPESNEAKILSLMERVTRQEAINNLLCTAIAAIASTHPERESMVEEWRHLSSAALTEIHLQAQRNPLMKWKSDEAQEFFPFVDTMMTGRYP